MNSIAITLIIVIIVAFVLDLSLAPRVYRMLSDRYSERHALIAVVSVATLTLLTAVALCVAVSRIP